jgi:hypothetical protein
MSDRMSYIILRGRWYEVIVLNVHVATEDEIDDMERQLLLGTRMCIRYFP